jgi:hypothetical protein
MKLQVASLSENDLKIDRFKMREPPGPLALFSLTPTLSRWETEQRQSVIAVLDRPWGLRNLADGPPLPAGEGGG